MLRPAPGPRVERPLLVGVDDDTLKWTANPLGVVRRQRALGAHAVRVWVPWHGEARPHGARVDELARAETAAQHTSVVLAVFGFARDAPTTPRAQRRYCTYAKRVLDRVPHARALVVWNEVNAPTYWRGTAAQYAELLARCYDMLHRPGLTILDSTAAGHHPEAFIRALGSAYRASGRTQPLVDAFGHNPYPRTPAEPPDARHATGYLGQGDYPRLVATLHAAFGRVPRIWYLEDGYQSHVPPRLRGHYDGRETVETIAPELQADRVAEAIHLAACQEHVHAFFNFELVDETRLEGWQSGLVWRGVHRKPAASSFAEAARQARSGCP
ncbi:MAG TPA: hypothetical protein VFI10_01345 [Gaiellaceae bacterium]|nr:hypothetical protein [Gaiellaceae bacterium]